MNRDNQVLDLTGQKYNLLTVVSRANDQYNSKGKRIICWHCVCDCGNNVIVSTTNLRHGLTKSCGCLRTKRNKEKKHDLTNQRFGRLMVKEQADDYISPQGIHLVQWHCICDCGNECDVLASHLKSGATQSCGCLSKEISSNQFSANLIGQKFGLLTVLERADYQKNKTRVYWRCICECGNIKIANTNDLTQGNIQSCGCKHSKGETQIEKYLYENNIDFISEKTFEDLKSNKGYRLRYDFYLPKYNVLIEYQGIQHYKLTMFGDDEQKAKERFKLQKEYDEIKRRYAIEKNINLLYISYLDYDNIASILDTHLTKIGSM